MRKINPPVGREHVGHRLLHVRRRVQVILGADQFVEDFFERRNNR